MSKAFSRPMLYKSDKFINRELIEVLPDGSWAGKPCFIIGGGPSLKDFKWSKLKGKRTIGINLAFKQIDPTIIMSMDTRFLNWLELGKYGQEAKKMFHRSTAYKVWLCTYVSKLPPPIFIVKVHRNYKEGLRAFTFSLKDGIGHGNNSGYAALNLAVCLGANPIYLLGFDCKHTNGKSHWHDGHPTRQAEKTAIGFAHFFARAAPIIKAKKMKVINLNPDSGLGCFPKMKPEEVL